MLSFDGIRAATLDPCAAATRSVCGAHGSAGVAAEAEAEELILHSKRAHACITMRDPTRMRNRTSPNPDVRERPSLHARLRTVYRLH